MTKLRLISSGLIWVCLAPLFYSAMSASAKLAVTHLSVWHIGVGRFGLGLLVIPKVSVMMTAEVPLVACFGVLYLEEPIGWRLIVGTLLIFGSGIGLNLMPTKSSPD